MDSEVNSLVSYYKLGLFADAHRADGDVEPREQLAHADPGDRHSEFVLHKDKIPFIMKGFVKFKLKKIYYLTFSSPDVRNASFPLNRRVRLRTPRTWCTYIQSKKCIHPSLL